jgi:hypothetical protein
MEPNPREHIGGNFPPSDSAIDRAKPVAEELGRFLADNPVFSEDEIRAAKAIRDRFALALRSIEDERKLKVGPLNEQVKAINAEYHRLYNSDDKRPGLWNKLAGQLWSRMSAYALEVERQRQEAARRAREAADEAARLAREAEQREIEAATDAASGVCTDIGAATEAANEAFSVYRRKDWTAQRAEGSTKVRIVGGIGNAVSLKDHETLIVTDWKAAIEEMSGDDGRIPQDIADAILKCARAHRKAFEQLPAGIGATYERSL